LRPNSRGANIFSPSGRRPLGKRRWRFPPSHSSGGCWLSCKITVRKMGAGQGHVRSKGGSQNTSCLGPRAGNVRSERSSENTSGGQNGRGVGARYTLGSSAWRRFEGKESYPRSSTAVPPIAPPPSRFTTQTIISSHKQHTATTGFGVGKPVLGLRRISAIQAAIRLSGFHNSWCTFMPSVALHVVEFTFQGGFESLPLRQSFQSQPLTSHIVPIEWCDL
jgi:hypothetical protein